MTRVSFDTRIEVTWERGERYRVATRGHTFVVDQPTEARGEDSAVTPTELFVASLVSCVAFYAGRFLDRHGVPRDGLAVTSDWSMATDRPARVGAVTITVTPPAALPAEKVPAMLAVARACTVHNSISHAPDIVVSGPSEPGADEVAQLTAGATVG